jgi:GR25 family glycosyltransferase involved in LPS biosynthesis
MNQFEDVSRRAEVDALLSAIHSRWAACATANKDTEEEIAADESKLRDLLRMYPNYYWIHYNLALVPQRRGDFSESLLRLWRLVREMPVHHQASLRLLDVLEHFQAWTYAEAVCESMLQQCPSIRRQFGYKLSVIRDFARQERLFQQNDRRLRAYAINLLSDIDRWADLKEAWLRAEVDPVRINGVYGRHLPNLVVSSLKCGKSIGRGTLGCFLGHLNAWQAVAGGADGFALVLEDDAVPMLKISTESFVALDLPDDWDICFVNERMSIPVSSEYVELYGQRRVLPVEDVISMRPKEQRGVGADAYLLSRKGAAKLLSAVSRDGIVGHVDFQLLAYCVGGELLKKEAGGSSLFLDLLRPYFEAVGETVPLVARCVWPYWAKERKGFSTRQVENGNV